jgi:hypothetical protein
LAWPYWLVAAPFILTALRDCATVFLTYGPALLRSVSRQGSEAVIYHSLVRVPITFRTVAERGQRRLLSGAMFAIGAKNVRDNKFGYRLQPVPVVGISVTHNHRRELPHRVHVAPVVDFRRVKWGVLLPLMFVANVIIAAIVWYLVDLLIR